MKRLVLLFAGLLIGLTTASASEFNHKKNESSLDKTKRYRYAQPIIFIERGVEFLIFPDGSFDFNTHTNDRHQNDVYYRNNSRRSSVNTNYRDPNSNISYTTSFSKSGVSIIRDRTGKVRRIGNVYLNYDRYGKITRAGNIYMNYSRGHHGDLRQIGGLLVNYDHWGEITNTYGQVNRYDNYCNFCGIESCSVTHNFENHHKDNYNYKNKRGHKNHNDRYDRHADDRNYKDDQYYYYKQNGKVKKQKKNK